LSSPPGLESPPFSLIKIFLLSTYKRFFNYPQLAFHLAASSLAISLAIFLTADGRQNIELKKHRQLPPQAKYSI